VWGMEAANQNIVQDTLRAHPVYFSFCLLFKNIKYETDLHKAIIFITINDYSSPFYE
jgi:hypothetical protein